MPPLLSSLLSLPTHQLSSLHNPPHPPPTTQDPADKSYVLSDDALKGLTGETRFKAFGFSKFMSQHIQGYA